MQPILEGFLTEILCVNEGSVQQQCGDEDGKKEGRDAVKECKNEGRQRIKPGMYDKAEENKLSTPFPYLHHTWLCPQVFYILVQSFPEQIKPPLSLRQSDWNVIDPSYYHSPTKYTVLTLCKAPPFPHHTLTQPQSSPPTFPIVPIPYTGSQTPWVICATATSSKYFTYGIYLLEKEKVYISQNSYNIFHYFCDSQLCAISILEYPWGCNDFFIHGRNFGVGVYE